MNVTEICNKEEESFTKYGSLWILGVCASVVASIAVTIGVILQKLAHLENDRLPPAQKAASKFGMLWSGRWFSGFFMLLVFPFVFEAFALGGLTIVLNQLFAPPLLDEQLSCFDWVATFFLFCGIILCTVFGPHLQADVTLDNIQSYYTDPLFLYTEAVAISLLLFALVWICFMKKVKMPPKAKLSIYAWAAGGFGAQQNIAFKGSGMLLISILRGNAQSHHYGIFYSLLILLMACGISQVVFMNLGLSLFDSVQFTPMYTCCLIIQGVVIGGIFYKEFWCVSASSIAIFALGVAVVVAGMIMLFQHEPSTSSDPDLNQKKSLLS